MIIIGWVIKGLKAAEVRQIDNNVMATTRNQNKLYTTVYTMWGKIIQHDDSILLLAETPQNSLSSPRAPLSKN